MVETLEGVKPQAEVVESTPKEEAKPTQVEKEPTVRTYTQKELDEAVGKGVSSIQSQLSLQRQAAESAKADSESAKADIKSIEAELQDIQKQHDELVSQQFAEDPEARRAYIDKRAIADKEKQISKKLADAEKKLFDAEKLAWSVNMARKADAMVKETGIDAKELESCHTEEEMEVKALRFERAKALDEVKSLKEPVEEKTPKFASTLTSGGGGKLTVEQVRKMSLEERAERAGEIAKMPLGLGM